jgi:hypothetical protein
LPLLFGQRPQHHVSQLREYSTFFSSHLAESAKRGMSRARN